MGSQMSIGATPFVIGGVAAHKTHQSTLTDPTPKCDVGIGVEWNMLKTNTNNYRCCIRCASSRNNDNASNECGEV